MDPISFFITRPWLLKILLAEEVIFFVIVDKLFDIPACYSRQNGSYRGISPHPSTKPP